MAVAGTQSARDARSRDDTVARAVSSPWLLVAILAIAFLAYAPTLRDWFSGDDFWFLRASQEHSLADQVGRSFDVRNTGESLEFDRYRPLYPIAWKLQYAVFELNAAAYHAVAVAMHLACVALVWVIARRLFSGYWQAHAVAVLFALHPVYSDAVTWISGANRVFAALPYFLAMLLFMEYRRHAGAARAVMYGGSFAAFVVAVLFHSSSLSLVAVLPAYVFLVAATPRDALRWRAWLPFAPFIIVVAAMAGVQYWVREHLGAEQAFSIGWHQYANYGQYLGLSLVPFGASSFANDRGAAVAGLQGIASLAMIAATVAVLINRRTGVGAFAVVWLYASLLPDSTLTLGAFGRTMYVTGAPLALFIVVIFGMVAEWFPARIRDATVRAAPFVAVAGVILLVALTYRQASGTSDAAAANERFVDQLRVEGSSVPADGILYVANAPQNLVNFNDPTRLESLASLYFDDLQVRVVAPGTPVADVERGLRQQDRLLQFAP